MSNTLSDDKRKFYENIYDFSKTEIEEINAQIERELAKVKERITQLNAAKQAARQVYEGACARLGIESEFDKGEDNDVFEEEDEE